MKQEKIVYFSLAEEIFQEVPFPDDATEHYPELSVLKGCLCVSEFPKTIESCTLNIWVMKEYGVVGS